MAIKASNLSDGVIEVIASIDSAINVEDKIYDKYLETLDETLLGDTSECTRFVMRRILPYGLAQKVQNKSVRIEKGEAQMQISYMAEEVRCALINIKNPDSVPEEEKLKFERGSDGGASDDLIAKLISCGIANDLFRARKNFLEKKGDKELSKKS